MMDILEKLDAKKTGLFAAGVLFGIACYDGHDL